MLIVLLSILESIGLVIDRPTKNMFDLLKKKKAKDFVPLLKDSKGRFAKDINDNLRLAHNHFSDIFTGLPKRGREIQEARAKIVLCRKKTVNAFQASMLDAPLSQGEIVETISNLKLGKSPGIDGLSNEFFVELKDFIEPYLFLVWKEAISSGFLPIEINTGVIKLIHKKGTKEDISNWRPITCVNAIYKFFSLALGRRLSPLMNDIILKEQKGFIKGRYILDAIISLWEGFEHAEESSQDFFFFKVDFDKAYDRIEWEFVLQSLQDIGFGKMFIKFIHLLFTNAVAYVAINGRITDPILLRRSIRQGYPLAPLLYAISFDALGWIIKKCMSDATIQGLKVKGTDDQLCLQQFADDTNAILRAKEKYAETFLDSLNIFCLVSGSYQSCQN